VSGVGAALITNHHVVLVAKKVHDLSLGFISPLKPHHARRTHGAHSEANRDRAGRLAS